MAKQGWIVIGVVVICLLGVMIARSIARSKSGLDRKEMAVARRAAGPGPFFGGGGGGGGLVGFVLLALKLLLLVLVCFAQERACFPRCQARAQPGRFRLGRYPEADE